MTIIWLDNNNEKITVRRKQSQMNEHQVKQSQHAIKRAIEYFGTQEKLAEHLGIDRSLISKWLTSSRHIPFKSAYKIDELTKGSIKINELRPDLNVSRSG